MRKVYDYNDIRTLDEIPEDKIRLFKGLLITATSALRNELKCYYEEKYNNNIYSIHDILPFVFSTIDTRDIRAYTSLRDTLEEYIKKERLETQTDGLYLRRNAGDMLNAMKLLIETGAEPDDIDGNTSGPLEHFKKLWEDYEKTDDVKTLRNQLDKSSLSELSARIPELQIGSEHKPDLFLFGFYFITPLQDRLFDILEENGYDLYFLNCHSKENAFATQIWEKTFPQYGDGNEKVLSLQSPRGSNVFANVFTGKKEKLSNIHLIKHYTDFDFAQMVKDAIDRGEAVYSPDAERCEEILREYFPDRYAKKRLLSYPVGQYIYYLHKMWDSDHNILGNMKYDYVFRCFATGWVESTGDNGESINGKDYLYHLKILETYFSGCCKAEEWKKQMNELDSASKTATKLDGKKPDRIDRMVNPLRYVRAFGIDGSELDNFRKLIDKLITDAGFLFEQNDNSDLDRIVLKDHLNRIKELLRPRKEEERLEKEEDELVTSLFRLIDETAAKDDISCPINGIRDAVLLLIDDQLGNYESHEDETGVLDRMVLPISMVEAAVLANFGQKVHLVLADETTLPGKAKKLPWPLTDRLLDEIQKKRSLLLDEKKRSVSRYIKDMRGIITDRPLSYRYLFYTYMDIPGEDSHAELSIEWICKKEDKEIKVSPYVDLLGNGSDVDDIRISPTNINDISDGKPQDDDNSIPEDIFQDSLNPAQNENKQRHLELIKEILNEDKTRCERLYIYSYLLNEYPSYSSGFHHKFLLPGLMGYFQWLFRNNGKEKDFANTKESLKMIFAPFMEDIDFDNAIDYYRNKNSSWNDKKEEEGLCIRRIHYLNQITLFNNAKKGNKDQNSCTYCPYGEICIDRKKKEREN